MRRPVADPTASPGTSSWLRAHNDRAALALLLEHGPLSRSQLSALSGLSKPTSGQMLSRLTQAGIVAPSGASAGARGPQATLHGVRQDSIIGVAVSIVADAIAAVVVDPTDAEHPVVSLRTDELQTRSPVTDVRAVVVAAARAAGVDAAAVRAITVGVQAAVDSEADALSCADTLPGWPLEGAAAAIAEASGMTVRLENDVNLAARAERCTPHAGDLSSFVYVWLGQGLGVGIDLDGQVRRGAFSTAGEIGYLEAPRSAGAVAPDALDFTDLIGGAAMVRLLGGRAGQPLAEVLPRLADDETAREELARRVALLISPLLTVLDPAAFILGGPTALAAGDDLAARVKRHVREQRHPKIDPEQLWARTRADVRMSAAGPMPVLQGARLMLVDDLRASLDERIGA